jgi:NTE family protein
MTSENKPGISSGLIKGQNIINLFCGLTANVPKNANFSDFPVSFACIGTDLVIGEEVILNSGFLPTAYIQVWQSPVFLSPGSMMDICWWMED